jgi:uncharacterized repeat protein (TIGR01451 family)
MVVAAQVSGALAQTGSGTQLINETFQGSSVPDPNFSVQGSTCLTGGTSGPPGAVIPSCANQMAGPVPPPGVPGYLQFTDVATNKAGSILYNRPIPSSAGVVATFDQWQYGGSGADGISFFLVDGATNLTATGASGGSLGYAQKTGINGILGGYVGIGLDVFGNFYNDNEGRGQGCVAPFKPPFPTALVPGTVTIRGPGSLQQGYCFQAATATTTNPPMANLPGSLHGTTLANARRRVDITITPAPSPRIMVSVDFGTGPQPVIDIPAPPNPPSTYKFGWSGSTGGSTDVHLLRNVIVKTVVPLANLSLVKQIDKTKPIDNPLHLGSVIPYQFVVTNSGLETLNGLTISDPLITNVTCPATTIDPAPQPTSTVICTGSHTVTQADLDASQVVNTATASGIAPGGTSVTSNPSTVTVALGTAPKIQLQKLILTPPPYSFGMTVTYRYDVLNVGNVTVSNPVITDNKVTGITCGPPTTLLPQGQFPSSTQCTATYVIKASDVDAQGNLTNTASATATPAAGGTVTSPPASLTIPVGLDIAVTKTVDNPTPLVGSIVTFTVTATNNGPANATGLHVSDPIVPGNFFITAIPAVGTTFNATTGDWNIGNLTAGTSVTLLLQFQVTSIAPYTNKASLSAVVEPDINPNNNMDQATITPPPDADVAMAKTVDNSTPAVGQTVTFTVTASNNGPSPATGVVVNDQLPAGLILQAATPSQGTYDPTTGVWTVGPINVGDAATLTLTVLVTQVGTFTNTTTKTAQNEPDPDLTNNTASQSVTATSVADLRITKTNGLATVLAGNPVTYTIVVSNAGPSPVVGAHVTDTFPPELTGITWTCTNDTVSTCGVPAGTGPIDTTVSLPVGRSVTFTANATVLSAATGTLTNTAVVMPPAGTTDTDLTNNTATDVTTIAASADLIASKSGPPSVTPPGSVVFTLSVTNAGPSTAQDVVITDPTPPGLTFVSSTGNCTGALTCSLGAIAPGDTATVMATYTVPQGYTSPDPIVDTMTVTSTTPDPVLGNNTASGRVSVNAPIVNLSITKDNGVDTVIAGTQTTYVMTVTNTGPDVAVPLVAVTDFLPDTLTNASWTCTSAAGTCTDPSGTGSINTTVTLPLGASATFRLTATVRPDATGTLVNTINARNPPPFAGNSDVSATDVDTITAQADLSITKAGFATVLPGNNVVYTITVDNHGQSTAQDVSVADPTPSGLTFVSNTGACTTEFPCDLGALAPGDQRVITATFAVPPEYRAPNPISNVATVSSATPDPNHDNNTDTFQTNVNTLADIAVTKSVAPQTGLVGDTVTFTIEVTNNGPNSASGVVVTDLLPAGLALTDQSPSQGVYVAATGQWIVGSLANGANAQLMLSAQITIPGALTNIATKTAANEPDPNTSNDSSSATVNAGTLADVGLLKTVDNPNPAVGDIVTFTVTATNSGPLPATNVVVTDAVIPGGLSFIPPAVTSQGTYDIPTGQWTLGDLNVGETATLVVSAMVTQTGPIVNTVTKTQTEPDPNPANDRSSVTLAGAETADVAVAKAISDPAPAVGEPFTFTVTLTNLGPETATAVEVTDVLPAGLTFVSATASQGTYNQGTGLWTVGDVPATVSQVLYITATPNQPGTFTNTVTRTSSEPPDPNPTNDSSSATGTAGLVADLAITKTDNLEIALAGQLITYVIVVSNNGPSPVSNARVTDSFVPLPLIGITWTCRAVPPSRCTPAEPGPGNTGVQTTGGGDIDVQVDFLSPGGSVTFTVSGTLSPGAMGTLSNTATVTPPANVTDPNPANNTATDPTPIVSQANLRIMKTGPATAVSGTTIAYTLLIANDGPSSATDTVVTDPTTAGLAFVSNSGDCTTAFPCQLGTLQPGDSRTITSTFTVLPGNGLPSSVTNTSTVSSPVPDPNPEDNTSSATTAITASADLAIVKTAPATVAVDGDLVYTIRITNGGPDAAAAVVANDTIPAGVAFVSVTTTQGSCTGSSAISCNIGTVAAGSVVTVTITVRPPATAPDTITNAATTSSSTPDANLTNNASTAQTTLVRTADLSITKTATPAKLAVGQILTYVMTVTNGGPAPATGVTLTDMLPSGVTAPKVTASQGSCALAGSTVTCALGDLAVNAAATVTITATRESPDAFSNTASVKGNEPDSDPSNNTATAMTSAASPEICGNCVDDDQNGLVDYEDPACCPQMGTLKVTKVRITPRNGNASNAKLRIIGTLEGGGFATVDPRTMDVSIRLADGPTAQACCTITQVYWMRLFRKHFGFWDQLARICPPVTDIQLAQKSGGAGISITSHHFDLNQLTGPNLKITVRVGDTCATSTVTLRRKKKSGAAVFP